MGFFHFLLLMVSMIGTNSRASKLSLTQLEETALTRNQSKMERASTARKKALSRQRIDAHIDGVKVLPAMVKMLYPHKEAASFHQPEHGKKNHRLKGIYCLWENSWCRPNANEEYEGTYDLQNEDSKIEGEVINECCCTTKRKNTGDEEGKICKDEHQACRWEERREYAEDREHGWAQVDSQLCEASVKEGLSCKCERKGRNGGPYECGVDNYLDNRKTCNIGSKKKLQNTLQ